MPRDWPTGHDKGFGVEDGLQVGQEGFCSSTACHVVSYYAKAANTGNINGKTATNMADAASEGTCFLALHTVCQVCMQLPVGSKERWVLRLYNKLPADAFDMHMCHKLAPAGVALPSAQRGQWSCKSHVVIGVNTSARRHHWQSIHCHKATRGVRVLAAFHQADQSSKLLMRSNGGVCYPLHDIVSGV